MYTLCNMFLFYLVLTVLCVAVFTYAVVAGRCGLQTFHGGGSLRLWWLMRMGYDNFMVLGLLCMRGGGGMCSYLV
jgi:hypothetical protein